MTFFRRHAPRLVLIALAVLVVVVVAPILVRVSVAPKLYTDVRVVPHADAVLVPGASVVAGEPSEVLAARADAAIALYRAGTVRRVLITGDNASRTYDEVGPILRYLITAGIPPRDIFLDRYGFDTYSSMYRARRVFSARSLVVVTQDFHLPRAVFLARSMGIDATGLAVAGGTNWDYAREMPATAKALLDLVVGRQPKYVGAPLPLAGAGNASTTR